MRVPDEAALGEATIALHLEGWPEGRVAPSTHRIPVVARKPVQTVKVSPQQRDIWSFDGYKINDLRYTSDGRGLLVVLHKSLKDGHFYQFRLWDTATGKEKSKVLQIDPEPLKIIYSPYMAISPDGKSLAVRYNLLRVTKIGKEYRDRENGVVHVIDLEKGRQRWSYEGEALGIMGAAFSPDGQTLVTGHNHCTKTGQGRNQQREFTGSAKFWDAASGQEKDSLPPGSFQVVWDVRFGPDGKDVWISDEHRDKSNRHTGSFVQIWDTAAKKRRLCLDGFARADFSPDGARFAASTDKGSIKIFDSHSGAELAALSLKLDKERHWLCERLWSADGKFLFLGSTCGELWRWEPAGHEPPIKVESISPQNGQPQRDAWPQDGNLSAGLYAFGVNGKIPKRITQRTLKDDYAELPPPEIVLWNIKTMKRQATFTGHQGQIECLAISPDGKTLVSGGTDGTVRFWDITRRMP